LTGESLHPDRLTAVSDARYFCRRENANVILHAASCPGPPGCTCIPYKVGPDDPRTTAEICAAADRMQRDH
jgi:hypothetical protein